MNDTKTSRLCGDNNAPDDVQLRGEMSALLAAKGGIDESKAKHLRKQWELRNAEAGEIPADLTALFGDLRERVHQQVELREKQFAGVEAQLTQLRAGVDNGDVAQAQQLEQSIVTDLNRITQLSSQRRQTIITELETLRPKLRKLTSWRKWSTTQAREKLIAEIAAIHQSGATIVKIAHRIQDARKEWQTLDAAGEGSDKKLYAAFDRACTKAYKPCQVHFDKQKDERLENSRTQEKICALLEQEFEQVEWRNPQWKKLQQLVRTQTSQWRSSGPGDYKQQKTLQQRFDAIVKKFAEPMERERKRNCKIREQLIADITQLAEGEDAAAKFDAAMSDKFQALKKQWVPTVTCARSKEQALWKKFSTACDAVHAKRDLARADFNRTLKENLASGEALCAEIENACRDDATSLTSGATSEVAKWKARWEQLGELPKASVKKITARYRAALKLVQKTLADAGAAEAVRVQELLREKSLLCAEVEALALAGQVPATQFSKLHKRWEALDALPDELEAKVGERYRLATAAEMDAGALSGNLETLQGLVLQLEILAEVDSPAEFSSQRMALQIERLSAAMGGKVSNGGSNGGIKSVEELVRDILLVGAVDAAQHKAAFARLERCLLEATSKRNDSPCGEA